MADARFTFTIARQLEEVFAVLTDPEKEHWITSGPPTIGSRRLAVTQLMRTRNIAEVTAYEANRMWEMKSVSGPRFVARAEFAPTNGGTRVDWTWRFDLQGPMRPFAPLVTRLVGRQLTKDFACLKRMMETGEL